MKYNNRHIAIGINKKYNLSFWCVSKMFEHTVFGCSTSFFKNRVFHNRDQIYSLFRFENNYK